MQKKTPKKKLIKVNINHEITDIFNLIKKTPGKKIYLLIPKKSVILGSSINLKILKNKAKDAKKEIIAIIEGSRAKTICRDAEIPVISHIKGKLLLMEKEKTIDDFSHTNGQKQKTTERKIDIIDDNKGSISTFINSVRDQFLDKKLFKETKDYSSRLILTIILISLFVFGLILYIALPGAVIYIKPASEILEQPVNINLINIKKGSRWLSNLPSHSIKYYPIEAVFEDKIVFETVSKEFQGRNARGRIKIINAENHDWVLKDKTRFQTQDGLIFRSQNWVTVPKKENNKNGEIFVDVVADELDLYEKVIGNRGNIKPSKFILPGLSKRSQKLLWGESTEKMEGGITKFRRVVKNEDIKAAKKKIENELLKSAKKNMQAYIDEKNRTEKTDLEMLSNPNYLNKEIIEIKAADDIIGKEIEKFEVYAKMKVKGIAYSKNFLFEILKKDLESRVHPDMKLNEKTIQENSLVFRIFEKDEKKNTIRISTKIKGIEEYELDIKKESGKRLTEKIIKNVLGMEKKEAEKYISNFPEVSRVKISLWPFWMHNLPKVAENITVKKMEN